MSDRPVTTDALETLGTIINDQQKRDAIHLAVYPVIASCPMLPGTDVGLNPTGQAYHADIKSCVGIVDPFLHGRVNTGERFWLVIYPRQIKSLRHVWEHPAFPASGETDVVSVSGNKVASEAWLRDFCNRSNCPGYEAVIAKALDNNSSWDKEYLHFDGSDAHGEIPAEFWTHVEIVTGRLFPLDQRASYFSCSC